MNELALQQINAKCDTIIALLRARAALAEAEIRKLKLIIYRNANFMPHVKESTLNEIIAEFEPNEG